MIEVFYLCLPAKKLSIWGFPFWRAFEHWWKKYHHFYSRKEFDVFKGSYWRFINQILTFWWSETDHSEISPVPSFCLCLLELTHRSLVLPTSKTAFLFGKNLADLQNISWEKHLSNKQQSFLWKPTVKVNIEKKSQKLIQRWKCESTSWIQILI